MTEQEKQERLRRFQLLQRTEEESEEESDFITESNMRWQNLINSPEWQAKIFGETAVQTPDLEPIVHDPPVKVVISEFENEL